MILSKFRCIKLMYPVYFGRHVWLQRIWDATGETREDYDDVMTVIVSSIFSCCKVACCMTLRRKSVKRVLMCHCRENPCYWTLENGSKNSKNILRVLKSCLENQILLQNVSISKCRPILRITKPIFKVCLAYLEMLTCYAQDCKYNVNLPTH